ncbi:MAG TPA: hypothetical protein VGV39_04735 [Mesorhizobium sp.]|jgi:hypothetical protein|uniref:hypothetical protein n=1 Tax=Mesorhizobium sp. TaxID=1871066 RepID=UPI002DDD5E67|nr:hypothetical protein [Mesorhizobium sp.]HEV2502355.1 hypothetical protein [Mesorhizobium sp.]
MSAPSARGLFRATGKKAKPVAVRVSSDLGGSYEFTETKDREPNDFYPTPVEPTRAFLSVELERLREFSGVWEPACGDGAMLHEFTAAGLTAFGSDLIQRGAAAEVRSFYDYREPAFPAIATNPPFAECNTDPGWIRHALGTLGVEYMALLLPMNWTGAQGRAALWAEFPPARVYVMRWRIDFTGQGAPPMLNGWFVWDRAWRGETVLRMLDRKDVRQGELFSEAAE